MFQKNVSTPTDGFLLTRTVYFVSRRRLERAKVFFFPSQKSVPICSFFSLIDSLIRGNICSHFHEAAFHISIVIATERGECATKISRTIFHVFP
jgi:hypothetical protein